MVEAKKKYAIYWVDLRKKKSNMEENDYIETCCMYENCYSHFWMMPENIFLSILWQEQQNLIPL